MKITVFGATGRIGRHVVDQLLARGDHVTAVVREPASPKTHPNLGVIAVRDLCEIEPLRRALEGADAVVSAIGPRRLSDGPVASTTTRTILRAMGEAGVERLVAVSATPVGRPAPGDGFLMRRIMLPAIKSILSDLYIDLARMEGEIELSGVRWTVVRPPRLVEGPATGRYRLSIGGNVPNGFAISRANVAHAMCRALSDPQAIDQPVGVAD